jgi:tRNA A-37 threonylcarbamoyl transferase component Bud32
LKALAPKEEDRYATGEEFRDALTGWIAAESPTTDAARVETFLKKLFDEDIKRERAERTALIEKTRERIKTLPPTHELRKMIEGGGPKYGRRATDRPASGMEVEPTAKGVAVDVPSPGPGGRTVVRRADSSSSAAALAASAEVDPQSDADQSEVIGKVLDGRYDIVELIGEGGMGRVYLGEHVEIGRRVAVKILHQVYSRMPDLVERFRREARAASRIGHPHIVDVTDSGTTEDGSVYFVMEYLEGVELANVIDREGALDISRALRIVTQICRALSAAHQAGIIHRDLKPENVFLTVREGSSDFVKVLDFGIAKSTEAVEARDKRLTHPGMAMGTPEYMAPEQAAGKPADQRCDVYAVGAILYEMLTGTPPYSGDNFMEILTKKATVDPRPPTELRAEIPEAVSELVVKAMARKPEDRPPSMEALEYELTKCLSGRGAAVAKILGMRGLAGRRDEPVVAGSQRASTARPETGPPTHPGLVGYETGEQPALAPTQKAPSVPTVRAATPVPTAPGEFVSNPPVETTQEVVPDVRSGALGLLGWGLLGAALAAAAAVVLFVASSEKQAPPVRTEKFETPAPKSEAKKAKIAEEVDNKKRVIKKRTPKRTTKPRKTENKVLAPEGMGPPKTSEEADEILEAAKAAEKALNWSKARLQYRRLSKAKNRRMRAIGFDGMGRASFELKHLDRAIAAAEKALRQGAGLSSRRVLANAHYRKGNYREAVKHYDQILKRKKNDREAKILRKKALQKLRGK